jgi:hypothetical protein
MASIVPHTKEYVELSDLDIIGIPLVTWVEHDG